MKNGRLTPPSASGNWTTLAAATAVEDLLAFSAGHMCQQYVPRPFAGCPARPSSNADSVHVCGYTTLLPFSCPLPRSPRHCETTLPSRAVRSDHLIALI